VLVLAILNAVRANWLVVDLVGAAVRAVAFVAAVVVVVVAVVVGVGLGVCV